MAKIYNEVEINPHLCTSGVIPPDRLRELADRGFEVVINLLPSVSEYAVEGEAIILELAGLRYVHIPVDFAEPTHADFQRFCRAMDEAKGKKVFAHCAANWRVSAFVSLYYERNKIWGEAESAALISKLWEPNGVWADFITNTRATQP